MKRGLAVLGLVWVSILLAGCSQTPQKPSVPTSSADENAIHVVELAWVNDWSSGNPGRVASHYADNAAVKLPGLPVMNGRDSIRLGLSKLLNGHGSLSVTFAPEGPRPGPLFFDPIPGGNAG